MDTRTLFNLTISLTYKETSLSRGNVAWIGKKWVDFFSLSIITYIALLLPKDLGSLETKSIMICSHFHSEMGNGCNCPTGHWCLALTCW